MPRYIDAAGLCGDLLNRWHTAEKAKEQLITDVMADIVVPIVVSQPTADVVERKKGFWEWVDDMDYRCSCCHKYAYGCLGEVLSGHYKYCPFCGCAMEGVKEQ